MWKFVNDTIQEFRECFSRQAAFKWFVVAIIGLMVRTDHLGVTSIIRTLGINPRYYESFIHFFRAKSWKLEAIRNKWIGIVMKSGLVYSICCKPLLIGDGVKQSKEGRKMPCVSKLAQESENSAKPQFINGHHFGAIGVLLGISSKLFCALLSMRLHNGNEAIGKWADVEFANESHTVRMIREACHIASQTQSCILTLDRYYLTAPALFALDEAHKEASKTLISLVTRAKRNVVAYEKPIAKTGRGRPAKKGASVKLQTLFTTESASFQTATVEIYGRIENVEFLAIDLLWGQGLYQELRFVLVKYGSTEAILVSTDLTLSPESIIEIYSFRFKIECTFREFKQNIAGFAYRFWTSAMPKLNRFDKNIHRTDNLEAITCDKQKTDIVNTFNAIEGFAMFAVIAFGLVQMVALRFGKEINDSSFRWLRTIRNNTPSEATTIDFLRKSIFILFQPSPHLGISNLIRSVQSSTVDDSEELAA